MNVHFGAHDDECGCAMHAWHYHYRLLASTQQPSTRHALRVAPGRIFFACPSYPGWYTSIHVIAWDAQFETFVAACGAWTHVDGAFVTGTIDMRAVLFENTHEATDARRGPDAETDVQWDDGNSTEFGGA